MVMIVQNISQEPDYKKTEIGIIPDDWEVDILKRFWIIIDCKHVTAKFVENGIPLASIREVQSRFVELDNAKQTTQFYYLALIEGGRKPQPGDLIFSRNATVGEIAQVAEWHPLFAMGQDVCLLRKKQSSFSSDYLQAIVRSPIVLKQLTNFMVGSTFKRVNVKQIQNLIVPMPSPKEQTAIATVLSDLDSLIEALDKLIVKKRDIKQATMQQLLTGKTRLPGLSKGLKTVYKQTEMGMIPEDWKAKSIGDLMTFSGGSQPPRSTFQFQKKDGYIRLIQIRDYKTDEFETYIPEVLAQKKCVASDIMIGRYGPPIFQILRGIEGAYNVALIKAIPTLQVDKEYFYQFLKQESLFHYIESLSQRSSGQTGIEMPALKNYPFPLPPLLEQQAIATVLTDMDAEIAALEQRREKTRMLKQGMMQELLTGKTRLV